MRKPYVPFLLLLIVLNSIVIHAQEPPTGNAADIAVEAAQQFAGITLTMNYEAGLQAQDGFFYGSQWTELTGINIEVIEHGTTTQFEEILSDIETLDIVSTFPSDLSELVAQDLLVPIDDFVEQYYPAEELADIHPTYLENWAFVGENMYAIPDDGDVLTLYYRRDLFLDETNQANFLEQYGYELAPPTTWSQWDEVCEFFTDQYAPQIYGCGMGITDRRRYYFLANFRYLGGEFFNPETMQAQINNEQGVEAVKMMMSSLDSQPPGVRSWGFLDGFSAWLAGGIAMTISWPPPGRWSEGYGTQEDALAWVPPSQVVGNVGYAPVPGGNIFATGFTLGVSATSENKEAAYLYIQWLTSQEMSLQRTMNTISLRDPYRISHFESEEYRSLWEQAPSYLDTLRLGADTALLELGIPGSDAYFQAVEKALSAIFADADIQESLDILAADWDAITAERGLDDQRSAYQIWRELPNAYPND